MADGNVGALATEWILENYSYEVAAVVSTGENDISNLCAAANVPTHVYKDEADLLDWLDRRSADFDTGFLVWWPHIVRSRLLNRASKGFFNTHPSLLPHNRGKHYNFWALVEEAPFGVTIHRVDQGVDSGPIVAQRSIPYDWTDNGGTLYSKAQSAMIELLRETLPAIISGKVIETPQPTDIGSFHFAAELDIASVVDLDRTYTARELLNLLRARTFPGHPGCRFRDDNSEFEVRVQITRVK